ncbi:MAG: tol-pal system protein YbgF [Hyphomicrobiaceae bacterium]
MTGTAPSRPRRVTSSARAAATVAATFTVILPLAAAPAGATGTRLQAPIVIAQASQGAPARGTSQKRQSRPAQQPAAGDGDAQLRQRVEQLEEQLVDIQVVLGTLQSLAQGQRAAPVPFAGQVSSSGGQGGDSGRLDVIETQIRALSLQIERLQGDFRAMGGRRSEVPARPGSPSGSDAPVIRGSRYASGFGTTEVTRGERRDPIGGLLLGAPGSGQPAPADTAAARSAPVRTSLPPTQSPKDSYETAYGYLLQQNYGAAETAFAEFVERHPKHALAGNAQYWLGETFFVRGDYKAAASAFLKGFQSYGQGNKAPESLLKLAISLDRLGERESACATFGEFSARFPRAPQHVMAKAETERRRAGC